MTSQDGIDSTEIREYNYSNNVYFNPSSIVYKDENDVTLSTRSFAWREGRKLESVSIDNDTYGYYYDENGLRVLKTLPDGGKVRYIYDGGNLDTIIVYDSGNTVTCYLKYLYNASGELEYILRKKDDFKNPARYDLFAVVYNGKGEITKLIKTRYQTSAGVGFTYFIVANYEYDAYGSVTITSPVSGEDLGWVNPLRYKNYIYDAETDWYYLQTRFYDPSVGRFLNGDNVTDGSAGVLGCNIFIYVANNPINNSDATGNWSIKGAVKWIAEKAKKVITKIHKEVSKINTTWSLSSNISAGNGSETYTWQYSVAWDTKGKISFLKTTGSGAAAGSPGASVYSGFSMSNAPSIEKLTGESTQIGGSIAIPIEGVPIGVGLAYDKLIDEDKRKYYNGGTINFGLGIPHLEGYISNNHTEYIDEKYTIDLYEQCRSIYVKIMEW